MTFTLPWPPKGLSPNARLHYMALSRAKKAYREACAWTAKEQGGAQIHAPVLKVHIVFYRPTKRVIDKDNLIASFKAGQDGLADVLKVDDGKWVVTHEIAEEVGGMVRVEVT